MTLRQNILNRSTSTRRVVSPEFLKGSDTPAVELRSLTVAERAALADGAKVNGETDQGRLLAILVIETAFVPGTDDKVFQPGDLSALLAMDARTLDQLADPALELNGLTKTAQKDAEKN